MKIPYDVINEALAKELPDVNLRPDPLNIHDYVLHFDNEPTVAKIDRAMEIVDEMLPSGEWYPDEVRRL
jgi:hypothetical protein